MQNAQKDQPIRLCLQRRKGFRLQETSIAANGRSAVKVDRTTMWGNPFLVESMGREIAVGAFRRLVTGEMSPSEIRGHAGSGPGWEDRMTGIKRVRGVVCDHLGQLRGKNLACWCKLDQLCHADVLLELANASD